VVETTILPRHWIFLGIFFLPERYVHVDAIGFQDFQASLILFFPLFFFHLNLHTKPKKITIAL
jgi:hypothetical protein